MHGKCIDAFARTLYTQTLILVVAFGSTYEDSAYVRTCVCVIRVMCMCVCVMRVMCVRACVCVCVCVCDR